MFYVFGYYLVKTENLSIGKFVSLSFYFKMIIGGFENVIYNLTEQGHLLGRAIVLYDFCRKEPIVSEEKNSTVLGESNGQITLSNISFSYKQDSKILNKISLGIKSGEKVAIVGTSGGGKSTVLKLIARFYDPTEGSILIDGVNVNKLSFEQIYEMIGYVFQETYLFGNTIKENIRFGNINASDEEIIEVAKNADAHRFIMELPNGYDTLVGERGIKLSGGQKQRIAIARMFIKNPKIILLDEATSALDSTIEKHIKEALEKFFKDRTIIAVAHRLTTIKEYDTIVVVNEGEIVEKGSYDELVNKKGEFLNC